jgi:geranylgeranyl diphosphate synthase type I
MLKQELTRIRELVHRRSSQVFSQRRAASAGMGPFLVDFLSRLEESIKGGKAVRAALVVHGAKACGAEERAGLIDLALAMELFHTYLLIHDDIIDQDDLRRGKPAFHAQYRVFESAGYQPKDPQHFGRSMAIMAGDILSSIAYDLVTKADLPAATRLAILEQVNRMLFETGAGEILDILNDIAEDATRAHLLKVHLLKTSKYSFCSPLKIGALAAGASHKQMELLESYALPLGIAYQLHDDLLGLFGEEEDIGKPLYSDLKQGKQTLLMIEARRRGNAQQRALLEQTLGRQDISSIEAEGAKQVVRDTGAYDYSLRLADRFKKEALLALDESHLRAGSVQMMQEMAEYIVKRSY